MKKTVLITGASSGFGHATARYFAGQGWNVVATMRNPSSGTDLAALQDVLVTRLDVQDRQSISDALAAGIAEFGAIDMLINNAGFGLSGVFEATPREKILEQFEVNVFGVMDTIRAILPHFRERRAGVIVNVSSGAGVFSLPMISLYCSSKFALEGFSEAITYELAPLGITVKLVEPGGSGDTGFRHRSGAEAKAVAIPPDYDDFIAATAKMFGGLVDAATATADEVAKAIFEAATDGTGQLRYVLTDDIGEMVRMRRETSEQTYLDYMRSRFMMPLNGG